ncbi:hypothetical protein, partial [Massilia sp. MS-15]|uniref:hypothetical protein n=1 Tax=Massilia sp. MS-15 TaxID=2878200 RepID=UPI001CD1A452
CTRTPLPKLQAYLLTAINMHELPPSYKYVFPSKFIGTAYKYIEKGGNLGWGTMFPGKSQGAIIRK